MTDIALDTLSLSLGGRFVLDRVSCRLGAGELVALVGPNGAGKTSLLRAALGLVRPGAGQARIAGQISTSLSAIQRARLVSYLPQARPFAWPMLVEDVVALGRFAHGGLPARLRAPDREAVARALAACELADLADRPIDRLSGGEQARVHLARALAAETPLLLADEPVAALDPRHQHRVMALLRAAAASGTGVLVVLHDLDLAARYADRLWWIKDGALIADGTPRDTLTAERVATHFGVDASIIEQGGRLRVLLADEAG